MSSKGMVPLPLAYEIQREIYDFLQVSFEIKANKAGVALKEFYTKFDPLVKGPFVKVSLPYKSTLETDANPLVIKPNFPPYVHQLKSFERLFYKNSQNTIVTTGTGSGKTECFLFPILDYVNHCHSLEKTKGIKAIILYPMNALLDDQSIRFAKEIKKAGLTKVRVGKYTGSAGHNKEMNPKTLEVINDRDELTKNPPDILLTNYKMLDYLLFRDQEKNLWSDETKELLKYLVLDEMHTFDGAQGSDVACLIRRLKGVVNKDDLTFVGTSATLSSSAQAKQKLCEFANSLFGSEFSEEAIILEDKYQAQEYLGVGGLGLDHIPEIFESEDHEVEYQYGETLDVYIRRLLGYFKASELLSRPEEVRQLLSQYDYFIKLIETSSQEAQSITDLESKLSVIFPRYKKTLGERGHRNLIIAFLSLASFARSEDDRPFLTVKSSLWVKELKKILAKVTTSKEEWHFIHEDDESRFNDLYLPAVYCSHCGEAGWAITADSKSKKSIRFERNHKATRTSLWGQSAHVIFPVEGPEIGNDEFYYLDLKSSQFIQYDPDDEHYSEENSFYTIIAQNEGRCPACDTKIDIRNFSLGTSSLTSVLSTAAFSHPLNLDRKFIAFSDSVQDASFQASFINNRSYNFTLRRFFSQKMKEGQGLKELSDVILDLNNIPRSNEEKLDIVGKFAPDRLRKKWELEGAQSRIIKDEQVRSMKSLIHYSLLSEFGFSSRLGWSMEKVGHAGLFLKEDVLTKLLLEPRTFLETTGHQFSDAELRVFIISFIEKLKHSGVIYDEMFIPYYVDKKADYFNLSKKYPDLNIWGANSKPMFFTPNAQTTKGVKKNFLSVGSNMSWFHRYLNKYNIHDRIESFYQEFSSWLVRQNIFLEVSPGEKRYALNPNIFELNFKLQKFECSICRTRISISSKLSSGFHGSPCQQRFCLGKLHTLNNSEIGSYFERYFSQDQVRINASEHTGALQQDIRERVEREFKTSQSPNPNIDVNFLSCTPTMEMGIDIGDLSSVILKNAPKSASSFFQRVGRSGRTTGNSLDFIVMDQRAHNQYFWLDPAKLLNWEVITPACRYQTGHILIRQYHAYVMDQYLHSPHEGEKVLPSSFAWLVNSELKDGAYWDGVWVFEEENRKYLLEKFLKLFSLSNEGLITEMKSYVFSSGMKKAFDRLFEALQAQLNQLLINAGEYDKELNDVSGIEYFSSRLDMHYQEKSDESLETAFPELKPEILEKAQELYEEKLSCIKRYEALISPRQNYLLGYVANKGLLPGYAFPEEGCVLDFAIKRPKKVAGIKGFYSIEVERSPSSALSDLAPYNTFYTHGYKAVPNRFDLFRKKDPFTKLGKCRVCGAMTYKGSCSHCVSDVELDKYIEFRKIKANSDFSRSYVVDSGENRDREFYLLSHHFQFTDMKPTTKRIGFYNEDKLFGYEFQTSVDIYSFNEGFLINGKGDPRPFKVCPHCGMIDNPKRSKDMPFPHMKSCKDKEADAFDVKLFRKITSDVVRIPVGDTQLSILLKTIFRKAIEVYLKGDTGHLNLAIQQDVKDDVQNYLVIYDNVPGGTGHLRDLFGIRLDQTNKSESPEQLLNILKETLKEIQACPCENGCYRCVWNVDNISQKSNITKNMVLYYLSILVSQKVRDFELIEDSIVYTGKTRSFDGATEAMLFQNIEVMARLLKDESLAFKIDTITLGEEESRWKISFAHGSCTLVSSPYNEIPLKLGHTKPDFFIENEKNETVAYIYADGAKFHVSPGKEKMTFVKDLELRSKLSRQEDVPVFTFTYNDLEEVFQLMTSELALNDAKVLNASLFDGVSVANDLKYLRLRLIYQLLSKAAEGKKLSLTDTEVSSFANTIRSVLIGGALTLATKEKGFKVSLDTNLNIRSIQRYEDASFEVPKAYNRDWQRFWLIFNLAEISLKHKDRFEFIAG